MGIAIAAIFFGSIAFIATYVSQMVCTGIVPADDGPPRGKPPVPILVAGAALLGAVLVWQGTAAAGIAISAIVVFALVACWCSDMICGVLPDAFTLGPLAAVLLIALVERDWAILIAAAVAFVPFAVVSYITRGIGMGWGDTKLVTLCGAALGAPTVILTLALASGAAVIGHRLTGGKKGPIALAPYIAVFTALMLPWGITHT